MKRLSQIAVPLWMTRLTKQHLFIVLFLLWAVSISGIFGNSGLIQAYRLSQARRDRALKVVALENEKALLQKKLEALKNDSFVQEAAIRESLGFVRSSEIIFEVK